jgi:SH3-like domain-containing protein
VVISRLPGLRRVALFLLIFCAVLALVSCAFSNQEADRRASHLPAVGIAYVGPVTMNLRQDLAAKSPGVKEVKHGDRLDIIEIRRRLARVRTVEGIEGWVDANLLLSAQQMDDLRKLAADAAKLPSQGAATVFEALNMHTEPGRASPSFHQIPEGGSVEVLTHRATARVAVKSKAPALAKAAAPPKVSRSKDSKRGVFLLPGPVPQPPPANWLKISRPRATDLPDYVAPAPPPAPSLDDWDMVRTKDGKVGWVLSRLLYMAVPDEVAQYAEGNRITAYLALGDVRDGQQVKHNWLWTTAATSLKTAEFDSFRVFVWSKSRHRYETAYIERNVTGFYPVELAEVPADKKSSSKGSSDTDVEREKGFSLVVQDKDGSLFKRTYGFSGYHVRLISKTPVIRENGTVTSSIPVTDSAAVPHHDEEAWWRRIVQRWRGPK